MLTAAGLSAGLSVAQEPREGGQVFPGGVEVVTVDVVVLDKKGEPVRGLSREDFVVSEDGRPQSIASFDAVSLPESPPSAPATRSRVSTNTVAAGPQARSFVVVFDDLHLSPLTAQGIKPALQEFLTSGLADGDDVTIVPTSGGAWWTARVPEGRDDLVAFVRRLEGRRVLDRASGRMTEYEAMRLHVGRDTRVASEVIRRYYDNGLLAELAPSDRTARRDLDVDPGQAQLRIEAAQVYTEATGRNRATLRVLERTVAALAAARGRKTVLLVSEGLIHDPTLGEFRDVTEAARRANAVVYFVDARGLTTLPLSGAADVGRTVDPRDLGSFLDQGLREAEGSDSVAVESGGFAIRTNDLASGLRRVTGESRAYYLIGYQPTNARRDGKFRKIRVEVGREGVEVRARKGYYAPSDSGERRKDSEETLDPRVRQALDSPFAAEGIPLRMTSYVFGPAGGEKSTVLLAAEADPAAVDFEEKEGRASGQIESFLVVSSRDTGENVTRERQLDLSLPPDVLAALRRTWLPILRDMELAPGTYQARLLLRDRRSGRVGTVRHDFEVPPARGLRASTPILSDTLQNVAGGSSRPVPLARRAFAPGSTLYCLFEVYGAELGATGRPRVSVAYRVRRADGTSLLSTDPRPLAPGPGGELSQMLGIPLGGAAPGAYELVLGVTDEGSGETLEVVEPFAIAAPPA
ncbi:MAG: VWA domain-containing protein [Acidobacteria bacterium]|nr:VWA domain-containing protein [Acidobacteriota bacterium]